MGTGPFEVAVHKAAHGEVYSMIFDFVNPWLEVGSQGPEIAVFLSWLRRFRATHGPDSFV